MADATRTTSGWSSSRAAPYGFAVLALATCSDPEVLGYDARLVAALERAGIGYARVGWDDPAVDWSRFAAVLIRTTWDYTEHIGAFRAWVARVAAVTRLWNPAPVVRWNSHKSYLLDLAASGVAVVPTVVVSPAADASERRLAVALRNRPWSDIVVKPAESVGSIGLSRWSVPAELEAAQAALDGLVAAGGDVLLQPLVPTITTHGETSLVVIEGVPAHAVRKVPVAGDIRSQPEFGSAVARVDPSPEQLALATRALDAAGDLLGLEEPLVYARVDMVDIDGVPHLMELELIEPDLYLDHDDGVAPRLVAAVGRRLA